MSIKMGICHIIGAAPGDASFERREGDFVIACDGGLLPLFSAAVSPDLIIGDFDSLGFVPKSENVLRLPCEKDDTDTFVAVREGLSRGYWDFRLYCCLGGRTDHTLANLQTLLFIARQGGRGILVGESERITVIENSSFCFPGGLSGYVSVFALAGEASGVSIRGLKYETEDISLSPAVPLGVSNEFAGNAAEIEISRGAAAIVWFDKYLPQ